MQSFNYFAPRTISEASSILMQEGEDAKLLSGGTDLIAQLREGRRQAKIVVDVKNIPELNHLSYDEKRGLLIGAAVACYRIYGDAEITQMYPGLIDAVSLIGGTAIQGRATLGGNVCTASPAGDSIPALIAHETTVIVASKSVTRELAIEKMFAGPGKTTLNPGEIVVAFRLPPPKPNCGAAYVRFIPRNEMDIAVVGAGVSVILDDDKKKFVAARIALGAVAPVPLFVPEAGASLVGKEVSEAALDEAANLAKAAARPISDMRGSAEQRKHLCAVMTKRALAIAVERASSS
jgi:carbon-monoxide dehydrogenase medium subunit